MVSKQKISILIVIIISLFTMSYAHSAEADIQSALSACENITPQQRQMASAAGYDIESLCSSANDAKSRKVSDSTTSNVVDQNAVVEHPSDQSLEGLYDEFNDREKYPETDSEKGEEGFEDYQEYIKYREYKEFKQTLGIGNNLDGPDEYEEFLKLQILEDEKVKLEQFGYDLFAGSPTTFAPVTEIPVVSNYLIGPGDSIIVQLFGKVSKSYTFTVSRDGTVVFPQLGPITIAGLTFNKMKELVRERVSKQMIGVQASITLGELRSIRVFILGDAARPGSYTVSSLSTMTNALFVSGGVRKIGSLRNIQLKRQGKVVTTLDLYDLLLKGDTSNDVRIFPGDVIFIPPLGKTAGVSGDINRPAIYELKNEKSVSELVSLAGGYLPNAYPKASKLERISDSGDRTIVDVDLTTAQGNNISIKNGDFLQIDSVLDKMEGIVTLEGHVYRPGEFSFRDGMKITDLVASIDSMLPAPDLNYGLVIRESSPTREIEVLQVNFSNVFNDKNSEENLTLKARDRLIIFAAHEERLIILEPILELLRFQEKQASPAKIVAVSGTIDFPGEYPLTQDMSVQELIDAGGGLKESTYVSAAEITRKNYVNPEEASVEHFSIELMQSLENKTAKEKLVAGDHLNLKLIPRFQEKLLITLEGEVKFPGEYEFIRGETLSDIVERAGGLTGLAHEEAAFFSREDLKSKEAIQIAELQERLKSDIAAAQLEDANSEKSTDVNMLNTLLENLEDSKATGRLVINLSAILSHAVEDVQLRDGDLLIIPTYRQEITIIGEVQNPTSHLFNTVNDHQDYIDKSGGVTEKADQSRIYVIKADGSVFLPEKRGWFHDDMKMSPGDTIVVPIETDRLDSLSLWTSVSQIVYQMALGAAAVKTF